MPVVVEINHSQWKMMMHKLCYLVHMWDVERTNNSHVKPKSQQNKFEISLLFLWMKEFFQKKKSRQQHKNNFVFCSTWYGGSLYSVHESKFVLLKSPKSSDSSHVIFVEFFIFSFRATKLLSPSSHSPLRLNSLFPWWLMKLSAAWKIVVKMRRRLKSWINFFFFHTASNFGV